MINEFKVMIVEFYFKIWINVKQISEGLWSKRWYDTFDGKGNMTKSGDI